MTEHTHSLIVDVAGSSFFCADPDCTYDCSMYDILRERNELAAEVERLRGAIDEALEMTRSWLPSDQLTTDEQIAMRLASIGCVLREALEGRRDG